MLVDSDRHVEPERHDVDPGLGGEQRDCALEPLDADVGEAAHIHRVPEKNRFAVAAATSSRLVILGSRSPTAAAMSLIKVQSPPETVTSCAAGALSEGAPEEKSTACSKHSSIVSTTAAPALRNTSTQRREIARFPV
jgi:hypothetical protein